MQTVAAVKQAYWTLKATRANVTVQQRSLELAQELARENQVRVDAGQIPPLDLVQAEAEVAQRRENLIRANTAAEDAEDALRRLIVDPADASFWRVRLDPVEEPTALGAAARRRRGRREGARRALRPRARRARAGERAGRRWSSSTTSGCPTCGSRRRIAAAASAARSSCASGGFPGLDHRHAQPRLRRRARPGVHQRLPDLEPRADGELSARPQLRGGELARAEVERRQAAQRIASLRVQAAETVRRAGRQIHSTAERVEAARAGATLAEQRLEAEQRRFEVGLSTTFLVTQAQRDLLEAQVNLLQTTLDYESALVNFEAVQQAPPLAAGDTVGVRGATVVLLPTPAPRGIFRPAAGFGVLTRWTVQSQWSARRRASASARTTTAWRGTSIGRPDVLRERGLDRAARRRRSGRCRAAAVSRLRAAAGDARATRAGRSRTPARSAERVAAATAHGRFALVLGGDCSIVLGCLLGARRTAGGAGRARLRRRARRLRDAAGVAHRIGGQHGPGAGVRARRHAAGAAWRDATPLVDAAARRALGRRDVADAVVWPRGARGVGRFSICPTPS